jgi:hypothetical protein
VFPKAKRRFSSQWEGGLVTVNDRMRVVIGRRFTKQSQARETRRAANCVTMEGRLIDSRFLPSGYTLLVAVRVDVMLERVSTVH